MPGTRRPRLRLAALSLAGGLGVVAFTYPGGLTAAARDARDFAANAGELDATRAEDVALTAQSAHLTDRLAAKLATAEDVIAGRTNLTEATEQFVALNGDDPAFAAFLHRKYDGSTLEEKTARNVIDFVSAAAPETSARDLVARLDRQFRTTYGHPR